jgi:hypothetical protein
LIYLKINDRLNFWPYFWSYVSKRIMKTIIKPLALSSALLVLLLASCKKEKKETDNDTNPAVESNLAESLFNEVKNITDAAADGTLSSSVYKASYDTTLIGCATVIHDTTTSPRTLIIDYGTSGTCVCGDDKIRKGKIIVSYTGRYRNAGTVITHTFDNFYTGGYRIEGTKTVTNMGLNGSGNPYFSVVVTGGKITKPDGQYITWSSTRTREWIAGSSTLTWLDDEYSITGDGSGVTSSGLSFNATINTALRVKLSCVLTGTPVIVSGVLTVSPSGKYDRIINYGSGSCDHNATLTINGVDYAITI